MIFKQPPSLRLRGMGDFKNLGGERRDRYVGHYYLKNILGGKEGYHEGSERGTP